MKRRENSRRWNNNRAGFCPLARYEWTTKIGAQDINTSQQKHHPTHPNPYRPKATSARSTPRIWCRNFHTSTDQISPKESTGQTIHYRQWHDLHLSDFYYRRRIHCPIHTRRSQSAKATYLSPRSIV